MRPGDSHSSDCVTRGAATLLADHLLASKPSRIVLIGCSAADLYWPESADEQCSIKRCDTLDEAEAFLKADADSDAGASVAVFNIATSDTVFEQQIGQAVRAFPNRLIIYTHATDATDTLFFAFGFHKLNVVENASAGTESRWYEYRLSHYKQSPDWLNARFWANPERFQLDDDPDIYVDPDDTDEEE